MPTKLNQNNMRACKAPPIPHLLPTSSSSTQPTNVKWPLLSRRLVLLSLRLATFLLPSKGSCSDTNSTNVNSTTPYGSTSSALTSFNPISAAERDASDAISRRISDALELLEKGRELQALGDFDQALVCFTQVLTHSLYHYYVLPVGCFLSFVFKYW